MIGLKLLLITRKLDYTLQQIICKIFILVNYHKSTTKAYVEGKEKALEQSLLRRKIKSPGDAFFCCFSFQIFIRDIEN